MAALALLKPCSLDSQGEAPLDKQLVSCNLVTGVDLDNEPSTECWPISCRQGNIGLVVKCSLLESSVTEYIIYNQNSFTAITTTIYCSNKSSHNTWENDSLCSCWKEDQTNCWANKNPPNNCHKKGGLYWLSHKAYYMYGSPELKSRSNSFIGLH